MSTVNLIFLLGLGFGCAFIDSSIGLGYGILTPILILLGYDPLIVLPLILFSQLFVGFSKIIYEAIYAHKVYRKYEQNPKLVLLFTLFGMVGNIIAIIIVRIFGGVFMIPYILIVSIISGIILILRIDITFTLKRLYCLSTISAFNQTISGAGYGPLMKYKQLIRDGNYKKYRGVLSFAEALISGFGFLLYFVTGDLLFQKVNLLIIFILSGVIATPLGILAKKYINKSLGQKLIGLLSILIGGLVGIKFILIIINF